MDEIRSAIRLCTLTSQACPYEIHSEFFSLGPAVKPHA